ncbi:MAG: hypothetical protein NTU51_03435 [Bacteroidetes bacterium]|nr:hypothetical protein [Bacteroidota bacterium]
MNRQQFSELVKDPRALGEETIGELENILKQYPYCQTAQVLLTFNLLQQNHSSYQLQLKRAVAYAGDRKKLKELLEGNKPETSQVKLSDVLQSVAGSEPVGTGSEQVSADQVIVMPDPEPVIINKMTDMPEPEPVLAGQDITLPEPDSEFTESETAMPVIPEEMRPNPEGYYSPTIPVLPIPAPVFQEDEAHASVPVSGSVIPAEPRSEVSGEDKSVPSEPRQENYIEESVISAEELALTSPRPLLRTIESGAFAVPRHNIAKPSEVHLEKLSQENLLSIVRKRLAEINEERFLKSRASEPVAPVRKPDPGEPVLRPVKDFNKSKDELIEKFIKEEPKIARPKKEFFNPASISQRSNMDEEDIVSETLALLYAKQGNMQKAIHIYEKLSLRFSEKSRYFAAQIENLKGNT